MVVLEKWVPKKPISIIYFDGEKQRYYIKRFLVETENKEELIITEHPNSQLEIVSTDYRPVVELVFPKIKGLQKESMTVDIEDFIAVKGFKALGNQLTTDKIKQVNMLEPLPYEAPEEVIPEEMEVKGETSIDDTDVQRGEDGQIILF
jgi:topoisomerase-4 subunit A